CPDLEVSHRAGPALLAIEAELIVVGRASFGVLETVRQQQETALEVDSLDLLAPELVADGDHDEAEVLLLQPYVPEQVLTHFLQTLPRERPRAIERLPKTGGLGANTI